MIPPDGSEHYANLKAGTIRTEPYLRTRRLVDDCVKYFTCALFFGDSGNGKSFAVTHAVRAATECRHVVWVRFDGATSPREFHRVLLKERTGVNYEGNRHQLRDEMVDLCDEPTLIAIDEAQHLNSDCTFEIRHLLDHPLTRASVLLIGGPGALKKVKSDATLNGRLHRRIRFKRVPQEVLMKSLPDYHRIYARADPLLLTEVDDTACRGELRAWAIVTHTAIDVCAELKKKTFDPKVWKRVKGLLGEGFAD